MKSIPGIALAEHERRLRLLVRAFEAELTPSQRRAALARYHRRIGQPRIEEELDIPLPLRKRLGWN